MLGLAGGCRSTITFGKMRRMTPKEPITIRGAKIGARAALIAGCLGAVVILITAFFVQTRHTSVSPSGNRSPSAGTSGDHSPAIVASDNSSVANVTLAPQTIAGAANVVAPGGTVSVTINAPSAPEPERELMRGIWLSEIRNMAPLGIDFRSGLGSSQATGIFDLLKAMYDGRNSKSYAELRELRDRILRVNPYFGYVNWLWGRILKVRFGMAAEAKQSFAEAEEQLLFVRKVAPESPYPIFYLALINLELAKEQPSVWYFDLSLRMPVHLWSNHMLPIEFNEKDITTAEAYNKWSLFWFDWSEHVLDEQRCMKACDISAMWEQNEHVKSADWPYSKGTNGVWICNLTVNMQSFPAEQSAFHYVDAALHGKRTLLFFDSFESAREHYGARSITKEQESKRIYDLPEHVYGFGDPAKHFFTFINATTDGLASRKAFPNELEIVKVNSTSYYYLGYCSTNDLADGIIRLYLDKPHGDSTNVLALPWDCVGQSEYRRPKTNTEQSAAPLPRDPRPGHSEGER